MSGAEKRGRWGRKWREGVVWPLRGWEWLQLGGRTTWRFKVIAVSQASIQMRPWGQDIKPDQIMSPQNSVSRFVDYFVICGYDHTKGRPGGRESCSQVHTKHPRPFLDIIRDTDVDFFLQIVQRFPERDWPDIPFVHGLDRFCQVENFTCSPFHECLGYLEDLKKVDSWVAWRRRLHVVPWSGRLCGSDDFNLSNSHRSDAPHMKYSMSKEFEWIKPKLSYSILWNILFLLFQSVIFQTVTRYPVFEEDLDS